MCTHGTLMVVTCTHMTYTGIILHVVETWQSQTFRQLGRDTSAGLTLTFILADIYICVNFGEHWWTGSDA